MTSLEIDFGPVQRGNRALGHGAGSGTGQQTVQQVRRRNFGMIAL